MTTFYSYPEDSAETILGGLDAALGRAGMGGPGGGRVVFIDYQPNNFYARLHCILCGGRTEKQDFLATFTDLDSHEHVACDECATAGPDEIRRRMLRNADALEREAGELRRQAVAEYVLRTPIPAEYCGYCKSTENLRHDQRLWGGGDIALCPECWITFDQDRAASTGYEGYETRGPATS